MTPSPSMVAQQEESEYTERLIVLRGNPEYLRQHKLHDLPKTENDGGADLSKEFFYLAGPMSNLPSFNFPAFHEGAKLLREQGYNICNPAEFDHEIARAIHDNETGSHKKLAAFLAEQGIDAPSWADCLRRDIEFVGHANCVGVIALEGWERSEGAQFETYVNWKFLRPQYIMDMSLNPPGVTLVEVDRWDALAAAGITRA